MSILQRSLGILTPDLASAYVGVRERAPQDAGVYFDTVRGSIERTFKNEFDGLESSDRLAPCYMQNFRTLWDALPERPTSIDEQRSIMRTLYIVAKQGQAMENFLKYIGTNDTTIRMIPSTGKLYPRPFNFRDAEWSEIGTMRTPGKIMQMMLDFIQNRMKSGGGQIETKKLFRMFMQQSAIRAALGDTGKIEGFYMQKGIDHGHQPADKAESNELIGRSSVPVDKQQMGIRETVVQFAAWENGADDHAMTIAILNDLQQNVHHDVFTVDTFQQHIPGN